MKNKLIIALIILGLMCSIPLFTSKNKIFQINIINKNTKSKEIIINNIMKYYNKSYCDETIKALTVIFYTNYKYKKYNVKYSKKEFISSYGEGNYKKIKSIINKVYGKAITYNNKIVKIPVTVYSYNSIKENSKYPYIKNSANPWDNLKSKTKSAVSINGINSICKKNNSYKYALKWYLRNIKIIDYSTIKKSS